MKKKILTVALVCAMMSAAAITANAAPITPQTADPKNGSTDVSYQVDPTYTITIPESVTLSKDSTVNANITAADVLLEKGKKITVTLTGASNTTGEGTDTFNAKNNESVATYTIAAGNNSVALGGEVASFTTDGTQDLTFSVANTTGVIYAGAHTETLTFTVSVEDAAAAPTAPAAASRLSDAFLFTYNPDAEDEDDEGYLEDLFDLVEKSDDWRNYFNGNGTLKYTLTEDEAKSCAEYLGDKSIVVYKSYYKDTICFYKFAMNNGGTIRTGDSAFIFNERYREDWSVYSGYNFYLPKSAE